MTSDLRSFVNATLFPPRTAQTSGTRGSRSSPPLLPTPGNYNSKRLNILHQDDNGMQKAAASRFGDADQIARPVYQPAASDARAHNQR